MTERTHCAINVLNNKKLSIALFSRYIAAYVQHNGSGVELRTLDYENPGSNPVLWC